MAELWALEQELSDEAAILQGLKTDKDAIENLLSGKIGLINWNNIYKAAYAWDLFLSHFIF